MRILGINVTRIELTGEPYVVIIHGDDSRCPCTVLVDRGLLITNTDDVIQLAPDEIRLVRDYYLARISQNSAYASALGTANVTPEEAYALLKQAGVRPPQSFARLVISDTGNALRGAGKKVMTEIDALRDLVPKERNRLNKVLTLIDTTAKYNMLLSRVALLYNPLYHHFWPGQYRLIEQIYRFAKQHGLKVFVGFIDPQRVWASSSGPLFVTGYIKYVGPTNETFFDIMRSEKQPERMFDYYKEFAKKVGRVAYTYNEKDRLKLTEMVQAVKDTLNSTHHPECPLALPEELQTPVNCRLLARGLNRIILYSVKYEDKWVPALLEKLREKGFVVEGELSWPY